MRLANNSNYSLFKRKRPCTRQGQSHVCFSGCQSANAPTAKQKISANSHASTIYAPPQLKAVHPLLSQSTVTAQHSPTPSLVTKTIYQAVCFTESQQRLIFSYLPPSSVGLFFMYVTPLQEPATLSSQYKLLTLSRLTNDHIHTTIEMTFDPPQK